VGIAWGLGIGAVVGPLPLPLVIMLLNALVPRRYTEGEIIDAKVMDAPNDKD
jgi:hypothetical protein